MSEPITLPVLLVEDDEPTRRMLKVVLDRAGFQSAFATNGREAIDMLRANPYAVVVLDVMMPQVGGREVVELIMAESLPVPVVICSAAGPRVLDQFDQEIVKAVIRKPFDVDTLIDAVKRAINPGPEPGG
ncbi:MAG TPA: response regulator [Thermoanaerobaculia bacterium]|nr:response regulator [Thermoanaerobaculia bacterium]